MEIRAVEPQEYEEAGRVTAMAYREYVPHPRPRGWDDYLGRIADVAGRAGRTLVLVAADEGRILGTATVELDDTVEDDPADRLGPDEASLRMLGVDPSSRGAGVGRALVEASLDAARGAGRTVMVLRTTELMKVARGLYERMGFERDPDRDYPLPDGMMLYAYRLPLAAAEGNG